MNAARRGKYALGYSTQLSMNRPSPAASSTSAWKIARSCSQGIRGDEPIVGSFVVTPDDGAGPTYASDHVEFPRDPVGVFEGHVQLAKRLVELDAGVLDPGLR